MRKKLIWLLFLPSLHAAEPDMNALKEALAKDAAAFERIELKNDGTAVKFEIELGARAVEFEGSEFDGFRFRCPESVGEKDFVWYFNAPEAWGNWYIVPVEGEPTQAFRGWFDGDQLYQDFDRVAEKERLRILQTLDGDYFKPGAEYLMWFRKTGEGDSSSLRGMAAFVEENESWDHDDVEKALALHPAPAEEQVTALNSRGGLILLDPRFFERGHAEGRIRSALSGIRSTRRMRGGFFITMQTFVPPCATEPLLEEILNEHGAPDFVREGAELDRVRKHAGGEGLDEDEKNITRHHYDHFAFEVKSGEKNPKVLRVGTFGADFSTLRAGDGASTFGSIDIENLTVFHRDGKEVGRAYYFLEESKKPLFITVPPAGEYRSGNQMLIAEGEGRWKWEYRFPDGSIARRTPLEGNRLHGQAVGFHPGGKTAFQATYKDGLLDGEAVRFDSEGAETDRRMFKDGEAVDN